MQNRTRHILLPLIIFFLITAFVNNHNPPSGWYQQTVEGLNGASIKDIYFIDSLTGYIVTDFGGSNSYILKTTNGGDNWNVKFTHNRVFEKVKFINENTGFTNSFTTIFKTTNAGENWLSINLPGIFGDDMYVLNEDTIWLAMRESLTGGIYRTTNGGMNWQLQFSAGSQNPRHIYMYNSRIGFADAAGCVKTTNGGENWFFVPGSQFFDMYFIDSLRGWKCNGNFEKTTNGGLNWTEVPLPPKGGNIVFSRINKFQHIGKDTIFGVGSVGIVNSVGRGLIYKTTNGGMTWGYQQIDTSINSGQYMHIQFTNKLIGWAFGPNRGVHTISGGDTTILLTVNQLSTEIPSDYTLQQNYPNPFNPSTIIQFSIKKYTENIKINVYDITGKQIKELINRSFKPGEYNIEFRGNNLSSGTYFYTMTAEGKVIDTKKLLMIK